MAVLGPDGVGADLAVRAHLDHALRALLGERLRRPRPEGLDAAGLERRRAPGPTLDKQADQAFTARFQQKDYKLAAPSAPYKYFRLDITRNNGGPILQLPELLLANGDPAPPPLPNMRSFTDSGPTSGYTNKNRVGFTGLKALRYSGSQTAAGRGYSYNKVFDVDVAGRRPRPSCRTRSSRSSSTGDLDYPSTNVAVDLAFTDGTYLSDLGATDQHGFPLTPQGQGAAKVLYANQWNHGALGDRHGRRRARRSTGSWSATTTRTARRTFQGWLDDVKVSATPTPPPKHRAPVATTRSPPAAPTASGSFSRGNNFPATAVPHGFNFWTPVTDAGSTSWLYDYARSNNAHNLPAAPGVRASHEPSPWMGDRQTFQVMPSAAAGRAGRRPRRRGRWPFRHENEIARPYYYGVHVRERPEDRDHADRPRGDAPVHLPGDDASLIFDNVTNAGGLTLDPATGTLTGYSDVKSGLSTGATRMFVYGDVRPAGHRERQAHRQRRRQRHRLPAVRRRRRQARSPCGSRPR